MMRLIAIALPCVAFFCASQQAFAQAPDEEPAKEDKAEVPPEEPKEKKSYAQSPHTAASVADAPPPEAAHNRSAEPSRDGEWALWIPRVLLFPVRVVGEVAVAPVRWGLYAFETYSLGPRVKSIFFNEDGTVGVFPTALIETGFGLNVGGRLILRRIVRDVGLTGRAGFGGRFNQIFSTKISTNETWKQFELEFESIYEVRPKDRFFGIGNGDLSDELPPMPLDPLGGIQRDTRFSQTAVRVALAGVYRLRNNVSLSLSGAFVDRSFEDSDDDDADDDELISNNFDTDALTGFNDGTRWIYGELQLTYDSRRASNHWEGASTPSTGWLAQVYGGYTRGISDDPARYIRYGIDLQRYFRLGDGPRTLALRLYGEGVTGDYDEVSFHDLARLGGPLLLRGYDLDRFHDRVATFSSAEYQFDASEVLGGFLFADVGRVYSDIDEIELADMRLGFGGGIQLHTKSSFLGRLTLATTIDGGFFASLSFDPVYDTRARVERK